MIFYLVLGTSSAPSCLAGTQADAKAMARERGTSWEQHDVPTDKAGLMDYVNQLMADVSAEMHKDRLAPPGHCGDEYEPEPEPDDVPLAEDGHPDHRSAFTSAQVAAYALPRNPKVQDICHAVTKLTAADLGYVALEVIARGARLGGLAS